MYHTMKFFPPLDYSTDIVKDEQDYITGNTRWMSICIQ